METILYFFRDSISGVYYFMYAFVCLMLMFSIIGYLFKQKYTRVELKLNSSQGQPNLETKNKKEQKIDVKIKKETVKPNIVQNTSQTINTSINNQSISVQQGSNQINSSSIPQQIKIQNVEPIKNVINESIPEIKK